MLITNAIQGSCFCKVSQGSTARSCEAMPRPLITPEYTSVSLVIPRLGIGTLGKYIPFPLVAIKLENETIKPGTGHMRRRKLSISPYSTSAIINFSFVLV